MQSRPYCEDQWPSLGATAHQRWPLRVTHLPPLISSWESSRTKPTGSQSTGKPCCNSYRLASGGSNQSAEGREWAGGPYERSRVEFLKECVKARRIDWFEVGMNLRGSSPTILLFCNASFSRLVKIATWPSQGYFQAWAAPCSWKIPPLFEQRCLLGSCMWRSRMVQWKEQRQNTWIQIPNTWSIYLFILVCFLTCKIGVMQFIWQIYCED